jgi:hypothetical protein
MSNRENKTWLVNPNTTLTTIFSRKHAFYGGGQTSRTETFAISKGTVISVNRGNPYRRDRLCRRLLNLIATTCARRR